MDYILKMNNGDEFRFRNLSFWSVESWIKGALMPHGVLLKWYEVFPGVMINTGLISSVNVIKESQGSNIDLSVDENEMS